MRSRFLKIEFQSDWHIGSGAGIPGSVDRQVLRDSQGLPYVPGKTLTGILRDAAEFVAEIRGGRHKDLVSELFGTQQGLRGEDAVIEPRAAKIGIGSAVFSEKTRNYILGNDLTSALFYVQPGIKIDPSTGCTSEDHLFSVEKTRSGCVLYAEVIFFVELSDDENKLLNDAVKAVRRIGGRRRRGAGLCRLSWKSESDEQKISCMAPLTFNGNSDFPLILRFRLTNLQPLIIAGKTVGNIIHSETEIPGHMLLSCYANKIFVQLGKERIQKAVMNGEIAVSSFLPELDGSEALPVPLCMAEKKESKELVNRLVSETSGKEQMKDIRTGYIKVLPDGINYYSAGIRKIIRTHNTVEDSSQRPDETTGGLFTYEALEAYQKFTGTVKIEKSLFDDIMRSPEKDKILSELSCGVHKIGRSSKDEYGRVLLEFVSQVENQSESSELIKGKYIAVYLKSDLLLRDAYNGYSTKIEDVRNALSEKLGVTLEDIPANEWKEINDVNISPLGGTRGHCIRTKRRDSWQTVWVLPRPSLVCFSEGSIFTFCVDNPENWDKEKAKSLVINGLGERTAEGYGQILINPNFICSHDVKLSRAESLNNTNAAFTSASDFSDWSESEEFSDFAKSLHKEAVRRRFRQTARREAYEIIHEHSRSPFENYPEVSCEKGRRPSASQFGALREAVSGGHSVFQKWTRLINKESSDNPWDKWCEMLNDLAERPENFVKLRPNFSDTVFDFNSAGELLGIFFDLLCEAVFDDEKSIKGVMNE